MSKFVIVGIQGEEGLHLIDLDTGSVEKIASDSVDQSVAKARDAGATLFRGIDVAISVPNREDAVGRFFFDGGSVR